MPFILIKNNLKLMLRSKWILFLMIILPVVTIALLSNAFQEMMKSAYRFSEFKVGYRMEEESIYKDIFPMLEKECAKRDMILVDYPRGDIRELIQNNTVAVFIEIKDDNTYALYRSNSNKTEAAIAESIFSVFFYEFNEGLTLQTYGLEQGLLEMPTVEGVDIKHDSLNIDPVPSSTDYYGIIYIVYFTWCGMVSLVAVVSSERKSAIPKRIRVSHISKIGYYLGKFIPCTLAIFIEVCAAWGLSVFLMDIQWGKIGLSAFILFLLSMAASAFGLLLFQLFNNVAISIVAGFVIIWIEGFLGGSFQTYMYSGLPDKLVYLSPLYWINRTLVEFSTKGQSDYTVGCIVIIAGMIVVFGVLGIILMNRKMEEQ